MKQILAILALGILACLPLGRATAQAPLASPGDAVMGHVHLLVSDVDANKKFWVAMGGTPVTLGSGPTAIEGVVFGNVRVLLRKADNIGPAAGSGINHIGFYVPNVKAAMARWKGMGLKTEAGRDDQQGFVWTPGDLIRVEILEMPGQAAPVAFHHVHLFVTANATGGIPEMQAWYKRVFGAVPGKRGAQDIGNVPGGELTFANSDMPVVPTMGRAVDHIGFNVKNLEAFCKKLEANGIKLDMPYTKRPDLGLSLAFLTDPWGTRIELNEPLP
jgi:catechol 2,3-dioxygenase-like lactoylglutathione lyase family enzyme